MTGNDRNATIAHEKKITFIASNVYMRVHHRMNKQQRREMK